MSAAVALALVVAAPALAQAPTSPAASTAPAAAAATPPVKADAPSAAKVETPAAPVVTPARPAPTTFVFGVIGLLALIGMGALVFLNGALGKAGQWSLANALSEEADLPFKDAQGNIVTNNGQVVLAPVLVASSSRLIALYGMFAILLLYLGVGAFVLYDIGTGQPLPKDLDKVQTFLIGGLTLFAPYIVNKFASVFQSLAPKP